MSNKPERPEDVKKPEDVRKPFETPDMSPSVTYWKWFETVTPN